MRALEVVNISTKTILLIDDEFNVRELVELCLQDLAGWNVVTADSLIKALQKVVVYQPDAIILDWSMRSMDGLKFIKKLREDSETQSIPLILLSAKVRWIDSQILQQYQVAGVVLKPFDPIKLPSQIAQILSWDFTA